MRLVTCLVLLLSAVLFGCKRDSDQIPPPEPPTTATTPAAGLQAPPDVPDAAPVMAPAASSPGPAADAAAAGGPIPDLPDYPGATQLAHASASSNGGATRTAQTRLATTDPLDKVTAFYRDAIARGGWQVTSSEEHAERVEWKLAKQGAIAEVRIERSGERTTVALERKDR